MDGARTVAQPITAPPDAERAHDRAGDEGRAGELREGSYSLFLSVYAVTLGSFLWLWRRERGLPNRIPASDLALLGVATHKTSRLLSKDKVAAPLRRPFARYEGPAGPGEVEEAPRGSGVRHAIGELLVCPYCLGQWVATGFAIGFVVSPRVTRFIASVLALVTASDFLQIAYKASEKRI